MARPSHGLASTRCLGLSFSATGLTWTPRWVARCATEQCATGMRYGRRRTFRWLLVPIVIRFERHPPLVVRAITSATDTLHAAEPRSNTEDSGRLEVGR